jgi:hypothetical protein
LSSKPKTQNPKPKTLKHDSEAVEAALELGDMNVAKLMADKV